ncbi:MAG TPA: fused response regulator/phosphatase [Myxococcales bacterium LLY-WYZ-16_1]|nr:fused response regulator/phosphatase [Myxococcales bacterium LLY-WYZ-16_1]
MVGVLVADDQRLNRILLKRTLPSDRYRIYEARDGLRAVEAFDRHRPEVVLLDLDMPELDGIEVARRIRRLEEGGREPAHILMITAFDDPSTLQSALQAGADDFVGKPFNDMVLKAKLQAAERTRGLFRQLQEKTRTLEALRAQARQEEVVAERVMARTLRTPSLDLPIFRGYSKSRDVFNGDLRLAAVLPDGCIRVLLGDFAGHGLQAAVGCLPVSSQFERMCQQGQGLDGFCRDANERLRRVLPSGKFLAVVVMDLDLSNGNARILNAGLPPVYLRSADRQVRTFESRNLPLGVVCDAQFEIESVQFDAGARWFLYSDGLIEASSPTGEAFGTGRLEALVSDRNLPNTEVFAWIVDALRSHQDQTEPEDDITLLEVRCDPSLETGTLGRWYEVPHRGGIVARSVLRFTPHLLRSDPMSVATSFLEQIPELAEHRSQAFTVVSELFNNALDHGVLGLDSSQKKTLEGFSEYYRLREARLEELKEGFVELQMEVRRDLERLEMRIVIEDSGPGFDWRRTLRECDRLDRPYGRGIPMVRGLCERLRYVDPGNRVCASMSWERPG